jgi:hypothetical protein
MKYLADVKSQIEDEKIMVTDFFSIKNGVVKTLTPYIGKKILKVDGALLSKINEPIEKITELLNRTRFGVQHKNLYIHMSYSFPCKSGSGCYYRDLDFYIGSLSDDKTTLDALEQDYSQYVNILNAEYKEVEKTMLQVVSKLKECEILQENMPYYAKQTLPYVGNLFAKKID